MFKKKATPKTDASLETLEDCITERNIMLKFIVFLDKQYALDNFTFWLEARKYNNQPLLTPSRSIQVHSQPGPDGF
jgi:hypothetical protein